MATRSVWPLSSGNEFGNGNEVCQTGSLWAPARKDLAVHRGGERLKIMCQEAEELFEEYYAAVEMTVPPDHPSAERRLRSAKRMLRRHNVRHRCCVTLRLETSTASGGRWKFRFE